MGAPKGNEYWKFRNKHGRDFEYTPDALFDELPKYVEHINTSTWLKKEAIKGGNKAGEIIEIELIPPMSIESFCLFASISVDTFRNYTSNKEPYKEFFGVASYIRTVIETNQLEGASLMLFSQSIMAAKLGLAAKKEITGELNLKQITGMKIE